MSADCWGESADKSIEKKELLELDEEDLFDGCWVAELLGFWESEWSEHILRVEEQNLCEQDWKLKAQEGGLKVGWGFRVWKHQLKIC